MSDVETAYPRHAELLRRRRTMRRIAAAIGVGGVAVSASMLTSVAIAQVMGDDLVRAAATGFVTGSAAAAAALALMPVVRQIAGSTLEARLLRAASPTHPLLRRLMLNAPGTYAHSVMVANLAETAADEIGANSLLTRVGAYYHDVGKLTSPCFFYENLDSGVNPHDGRPPSESVAIITSHVDDGLELGESYALPSQIKRIIEQHHGNSLVRYFYHQAAREDAGVYEGDFRYHGRRPDTREAALVMLADACEAAVRAQQSPPEERIAETVDSIFAEKSSDHQLEQSGLSEADCDSARAVYTRMLTSMSHARCEYPKLLAEARKEATCRSAS